MREVMTGNMEPQTVVVDRAQLISRLDANLEAHKRAYDEAMLGYKETALKKLEEAHAQARTLLGRAYEAAKHAIETSTAPETYGDTIVLVKPQSISLPVPRDHSRAYEVAIKMATWDVRPTIELTQAQFQCFILDDWEWQGEFRATVRSYSKGA